MPLAFFGCRSALSLVACSSFSRLFLHRAGIPRVPAYIPMSGDARQSQPLNCRNVYASATTCGAAWRALTVQSFYAILRPSGVPNTSHLVLSLVSQVIERSSRLYVTRAAHRININMYQGYLDCKGTDGTSTCVARFSESPGLVRPDNAGAPKISPEPSPDSQLHRSQEAGVAGDPSVIIRGDMHTCPVERTTASAHILDE